MRGIYFFVVDLWVVVIPRIRPLPIGSCWKGLKRRLGQGRPGGRGGQREGEAALEPLGERAGRRDLLFLGDLLNCWSTMKCCLNRF